jgi:hypothetical protein
MNSEVMSQIEQIIEAKAQQQPTPMEFELAYQARVAMDRIRFAIKHTEQFAPHTDPIQEAGLQLLDALQRLETAERRFQERSRISVEPKCTFGPSVNGHGATAKGKREA